MSEFIGSRISLISKSDIRYVGTLHEINSQDATVALEQVKSFGTEGRKGDPEQDLPGSDSVYEYIVFRGSDVKDLRIEEAAPKENKPPPMPDDPAILGSGSRPSAQNDQQRPMPPQQQQQQRQHQQQQQQGFPAEGPPPHFQQHPQMPYQQYNQFPNQRFPGPQGPPQPGFSGYGGMPYGGPPHGYFPPGQGLQGPPGPFPPHQQMQFPPGAGPRGPPPQQSPQQQDAQASGTPNTAEAPAAPVVAQQSSSTPKAVSQANTPGPSAQATQAPPPPPVESKPDVATALGAPSTNQPMAAKAIPTGPRAGKITPAIPLINQIPRGPAAQANVPKPGQAAADAAMSYQNAAQAASAAVANAMAKLPQAPGPKPSQGGAVDNLTQKVNQMRVDDRARKQSGSPSGSNPGYRGGRGGRGRGGQQNRGIAVPSTDFDFESANAQFSKENIVKEAHAPAETAAEEGVPTPVNGNAVTADGAADVVIPDAAASTAAVYSKSSFFDNISSEAKDREDGVDGRRKPGGPEFRSEERKRNMETFGLGSVDGGYRGGYRGRGRGRGRGGGGGGGYRGAPRGGSFRGGRGTPTNPGGIGEA